jgi:hypothetical protein
MIKLGAKSENGPSTHQKVLMKSMWLLATCRNAIVVVAGGVLGFWFVNTHGSSPVRLMGQYSTSTTSTPPLIPIEYLIDQTFLCHARQPKASEAVSNM